jgi:hypothetical protein
MEEGELCSIAHIDGLQDVAGFGIAQSLDAKLLLLCWLHGTSVQKTHRLHQPDFPFLSLSSGE